MKNYSPKGRVLWDSWFIKKDDEYHVFYLEALPSKNPNDVEYPTSIGHAVSKDLMKWKEIGTALKPSKKGWDDAALWTGSVIEKDGKYYMFYTGRDKKQLLVQRIGLAISDDLINWKKHPKNPIVVAKKDFYHMDDKRNKLGKVGAWRDPFVFRVGDKYYMTISARTKGKKQEYNGCVAVAESKDLIKWKIRKPLISPRVYDEMETTQMVIHKERYYLFFSTDFNNYERKWAEKHGKHSGLHCYYSDKLFGKYKPVNKNGVVLDNGEEVYDIRLVDNIGDRFIGVGWLNKDKKGKFLGKLSDVFRFVIEGDQIF